MRYSKSNLKKLEEQLIEQGYTLRYERGNFQSGYCIVQDRKVAVVNKFYDVKARMICIQDILENLATPGPANSTANTQELEIAPPLPLAV